MSETWYQSKSDVLSLPSYRSFYLKRTSTRCSGMAFLGKANMNSEILPEFSGTFSHTEALTLRHLGLMFSVIYCPSQGDLSDILDYFDKPTFYATGDVLKSFIGGALTFICT